MQSIYHGHPRGGLYLQTPPLPLRHHSGSRMQGMLLSTTLLYWHADATWAGGFNSEFFVRLYVFLVIYLVHFLSVRIGFAPAVVVADPALVRS